MLLGECREFWEFLWGEPHEFEVAGAALHDGDMVFLHCQYHRVLLGKLFDKIPEPFDGDGGGSRLMDMGGDGECGGLKEKQTDRNKQ